MEESPSQPTGPDLAKGVAAQDITEGKTLLGHIDDEPVFLTRCGQQVVALTAKCPHYGGPLNEGLIVGETIRCPWHHGAFSLRTGEMLRPPPLNDVQCWNVEERDGRVTVIGKRDPVQPKDSAYITSSAVSPTAPESIIIIGAGAAGAVAASTLRRMGYDRPITLFESGPFNPYDRPNLSKDYLAGTAPEAWIPLHPDSFYADHNIEILRNRTVSSIDPQSRHISLGDGTTRDFGALLIATGATPVILNIPNPGQGIHYLRTLSDSRAIIQAAARTTRVVVIGASFIGLEVAASLRMRGLDVAVVAPESQPLERVLGPELGLVIRQIHEHHGIIFHLGQTVSAIDPTSVTLNNGTQLDADFVVAGIGVRPNIALAESAGLTVDNGVVVDEYLQTSAQNIYAAGDIARWPDPHSGERIRVEHWVVAERQGQVAARNMLAGAQGGRTRFDAVPFFWSQHYDMVISYVGHAAHWDTITVDGNLAAHDGIVTYQANGKTLATATIFRDDVSLAAERAMEKSIESRATTT